MSSKQLFILLINGFTSIAVSYFYFNHFTKKKHNEIESKLQTLFYKYRKLENKLVDIDSHIQDLDSFIEEIDYIIENKKKPNNTNYQNVNNIDEYIMLVE
jgi:peptidoglycan hydrolase CwlO-like protein